MNLPQTQILILGLIDSLLDSLKAVDNRKKVQNTLLAGILATFTNKLLENSQTSETIKGAITSVSAGSDPEMIFKTVQKYMEDKTLNFDVLPLFQASAKEVLGEFVTKSGKPELVSQINLILQ